MSDTIQPSVRPRVLRWIAGAIVNIVAIVLLWFLWGPPHFWYLLGTLILVEGVRFVWKKYRPHRSTTDETAQSERSQDESASLSDPRKSAKARWRLVWQFALGLLYMAFVSLILAEVTARNYFVVFMAVVVGMVFTGALIAVWAASPMRRAETHKNQFSIMTMLFLMTILAIYLSTIRVLADLTGDSLGGGILGAAQFCAVLTAATAPFLIYFTESLVWLAAWLVRRPWVQRLLGNS